MWYKTLDEEMEFELQLRDKFKQLVSDCGIIDNHDVISHWIAGIHFWRKKYQEDERYKGKPNPVDTRIEELELLPCADAIAFVPPMAIVPAFFKGSYDNLYQTLLDLIQRPSGDRDYLMFVAHSGAGIII